MASKMGHNSGDEDMSDINQTLASINSQLSSIDGKLDNRVQNVTFYGACGIIIGAIGGSFLFLNSQISTLTSKFDLLHGQLIGNGTISTSSPTSDINTDSLLYTVSK